MSNGYWAVCLTEMDGSGEDSFAALRLFGPYGSLDDAQSIARAVADAMRQTGEISQIAVSVRQIVAPPAALQVAADAPAIFEQLSEIEAHDISHHDFK